MNKKCMRMGGVGGWGSGTGSGSGSGFQSRLGLGLGLSLGKDLRGGSISFAMCTQGTFFRLIVCKLSRTRSYLIRGHVLFRFQLSCFAGPRALAWSYPETSARYVLRFGT